MDPQADREDCAALEQETHRIGRQLLLRTRRYQAGWFSPYGIEERIKARLLGNEALRAALLRFVDVFPALRTDREIAVHVADYLDEAAKRGGNRHPIRSAARAAEWARTRQWLCSLAAALSRYGVHRTARRFIVESGHESITRFLERLEAKGYLFTLDVLGETVHSEKEARGFLERYLDLAGNLGNRLPPRQWPPPESSGPRVNLSIKLSSLTPHFDPMDPDRSERVIGERLRELFRAARRAGSFINVDMESRVGKDLTLCVFRGVLEDPEFRDWPDVGIVVQAYLRDAEDTVEDLLGWVERRGTEITIRLVKGAYWDSEQIWALQRRWPIPVYLNKAKTDVTYERCLERLLRAHKRVRTAIGSHNARSIARAIALAERFEVPRGRLEIQMLHGMAEPLRRAVRDEAAPVRIYVPTGQLVPGMAYLVRRLLENTSQNSFVRQMSVEHAAIDSLLASPEAGAGGVRKGDVR